MEPTVWVPVASALLAVVGVLLAQMMANRRVADERREQWERERQRWAREDAARTYEERRAAYLDFMTEVGRARQRIFRDKSIGKDDPWENYLEAVSAALERIEVYGTLDAAEAAIEVFVSLLAFERLERVDEEAFKTVNLKRFRQIVRRDLGIPAGAPTS